MRQKTSDKFIHIYKEFTEDECWERAEKSAKHLLSSIAFKENSTEYTKKTNSVLLSPIGYYYSIFHMSLSLCWLNPEITKDQLTRIKHTSLQNLINEKFVSKGLLNKSYGDLMLNLKEEREWLNYSFGEFNYDFFENAEENKELLNFEFKKGFALMDEICEILEFKFDIKQRIKTYIADSKGDDLLQTYLSESEQDLVMNFIVKNGYSN